MNKKQDEKQDEKLALIESIKLWKWLEKNPTKEKLSYPFKNVRKWENYCPLCDLAQRDCHKCLMVDVWYSFNSVKPCSSIYYAWSNLMHTKQLLYDRSFFAAVLVEDLVNKLKGETK